jgi:acetyl esterase/lipase
MPLYPLMVVRVVAAELALHLALVELAVLAVALAFLRGEARIAVALVAAIGMALASVPVLRLPGTIAALDAALDAIGAPPGDGPVFSLGRALTGLPAPDVRVTADIAYRSVGERTLRLDRYDGAGAGPHPALVVVHGGSWRNGDKGAATLDPRPLNRLLAARGITVYDIQYRLVPEATFPAPLEDVRCALGHVRAQAAADDVDPERVALLGRSAGGELALLAAYATGPAPAGCGAPATVRGVISLYGPTDLERGYRVPAEPDLIDGSRTIAEHLGGTPDAIPAVYASATPQRVAGPGAPPTLLLHGSADQIVAPYHATSLAAALSRNGTPVALVELPWAGHGFDGVSFGPGGQLALAAVGRFLALVLGR